MEPASTPQKKIFHAFSLKFDAQKPRKNVFSRMLPISRMSASDYNEIGKRLLEKGQPNSALRKFSAAIRRDPAFGEAYCNRARAEIGRLQIEEKTYRLGSEDYAKAFADLHKAIELDPESAHSFALMAELCWKFKAYGNARAARFYDASNALSQPHMPAKEHLKKAYVLFSQEKFASALVEVDAALLLNPTLGRGYFLRAQCRERTGNYKFESDVLDDYADAAHFGPKDEKFRAQCELNAFIFSF